MGWLLRGALIGAALLASCVGTIGEQEDGAGVVDADQVAMRDLARLSTAEYFATVRDLLSEQSLPVFELMPADARTPFDNDVLEQVASQGLIDAADFLAEGAADQLIADPPRLAALLGCTPSGPGDEACLRTFVTSFGRRAFRRALTQEEIDAYVLGRDGGTGALAYATEANDFNTGVHSVVWSMLQDPAFLYRIEIGTPVEGQTGIYELTQFEIASRLSYFIWGSMPDDQLLDRAQAGGLGTPEALREEALRMMTDERALARIARFHAMWMGYEVLPHTPELSQAMKAETEALVKRVIFEEQLPWERLLTFEETFVNDLLADQYGLAPPALAEGDWVPYADSGRAGILSHGSFLSIGAKFNDTSPVQRGLVIRERLFCDDIADPPPGVDVDAPVMPENTVCKIDRFAAHSQGGCATCHSQIDPLGFGLENYDQLGRFRTNEPDNPDTPDDETQCVIEGRGEFEQGEFHGPAELGALAVESGLITRCLSKQLYRFVAGRSKLDSTDRRVVAAISERVGASGFTFGDLVLEVVSHPSFAYRSTE
jgi:hypothetical protein